MVSVALCTYNGEKYIEEQLTSIIEQSTPVDEIVICDDCSTDTTIEIITDFKERHPEVEIQVSVNENNVGVTKNFENALRKCNGEIIFLSDQDDIWHTNKVEKMTRAFNSDSKCLLVYTDAYLVDANGNELGVGLWELTKPILKENYTVSDFTGARYITGATVALRKELLVNALPIPECWIHDAWLSIIASAFGSVKFIEEKLLYYRQHETNVIGAKRRTFLKQVLYTKANIRKSIAFRDIMRDRFISLNKLVGSRLTDEEIKNLKRCIDFWDATGKLYKCPKVQGLRIILSNLFAGNYTKYNHGMYGAMVDLFILIKQ